MLKNGVVVGVCPASERQCRALSMCWVEESVLGVSSNAGLPAKGTGSQESP